MNQNRRIYKVDIEQYMIGIVGILINGVLMAICFLFNWEILAKIIFTIGLTLSLYSVIDLMVSYYEVNDYSIKYKTLTKETIINWKDVKRLVEAPKSTKNKLLVYVFCDEKSLYIPYWIINQNKLLLEIISNLKDKNDIYIAPSILRLVK